LAVLKSPALLFPRRPALSGVLSDSVPLPSPFTAIIVYDRSCWTCLIERRRPESFWTAIVQPVAGTASLVMERPNVCTATLCKRLGDRSPSQVGRSFHTPHGSAVISSNRLFLVTRRADIKPLLSDKGLNCPRDKRGTPLELVRGSIPPRTREVIRQRECSDRYVRG
jgi:hypothetical protein